MMDKDLKNSIAELERRKLGTRIASLRKENNLTQAQLADKIEISRISVGNYEKGDRTPDAEVIQKLSMFFGCSSDYLLGLSNAKRPENATLSQSLGLSDESVEIMKHLYSAIGPDDTFLFPDDGIMPFFNSLIEASSFSEFLHHMRILSHPQLSEFFKLYDVTLPPELGGTAIEYDMLRDVENVRLHNSVEAIINEIKNKNSENSSVHSQQKNRR